MNVDVICVNFVVFVVLGHDVEHYALLFNNLRISDQDVENQELLHLPSFCRKC